MVVTASTDGHRIAPHGERHRIEAHRVQRARDRVDQIAGLPGLLARVRRVVEGATYSAWLPPRISVVVRPVVRSRTATCAVSIPPLDDVMVNSTARPPGRMDGKR